MPLITINEIKHQFRKRAQVAIEEHNKAMNSKNISVLKNINVSKQILKKFPILSNVCEEFESSLDKELKKANATILEYPTINIGDVFHRYFDNDFPFNSSDKKHEFPDAFALLTVELWTKEKRTKCVVLATDKDLQNFSSANLICDRRYETYLDSLIRKIEKKERRQKRLDFISKLYDKQKAKLEAEIEDWFWCNIANGEAFKNYSHVSIYEVSLEKCTVTLSDFQIINITDNSIQVESNASISFKVAIEIDNEDSGWYDSEEKEWHYSDTITEIEDGAQNIPVTLTIDIPLAGEEYSEFKINEINNDKNLYL
jgi:hypothetical protein